MKSDESAFSIVPSRLSSRFSVFTGQSSRRGSIDDHTIMEYYPLSFENDLFTARVYKRNYRNTRSQRQQSEKLTPDHETIVPERRERQPNEAVLRLMLQPCSQGKTTTTIAANKHYVRDVKPMITGIIVVSTIDIVSSTAALEEDLEHRVSSSSSGQDGLYVRLAENLEHRIDLSTSANYVELVMACSSGDNKTVKEKLAMMPPVLGSYISGSFYFCPIHATVFNGHLEVMRTLLRKAQLEGELGQVLEKTIGGTEIDRWRPLHVATSKGNLAMVKLLLEKGATVQSPTGHGIQAAHLAARIGSISILQALFDAGAHVNCSDLHGHRPIHYISESQDLPHVIHYLGQKGADVSGVDSAEELTPLLLACEHSFAGNIKALLSLRAPVTEHPSLQLDSALDTALRCGSSSAVQTLLKHAVISEYSHYGRLSGLHTFILRCCTATEGEKAADRKFLRRLLEEIELLLFDDSGETVLNNLLPFGCKDDFTRLLMENLPADMAFEKRKMISMIYRREEVTPISRSLRSNSLVEDTREHAISAPVYVESSLAWN